MARTNANVVPLTRHNEGALEVKNRVELKGARRLHPMEKRRLSLTNQDTHTKSFRLDGKVAVVTGGGSGIGLDIPLRVPRNVPTVRILDLNEQDATAACQQI